MSLGVPPQATALEAASMASTQRRSARVIVAAGSNERFMEPHGGKVCVWHEPSVSWHRLLTQPPESQSVSLVHDRRAQTPCRQAALAGQAEPSWHSSGSQRCAAPQVVSGLGHGAWALQPGTQTPALHTPVSQSSSEAQTKHLVSPPAPAQ